jgi:hypothetical protein
LKYFFVYYFTNKSDGKTTFIVYFIGFIHLSASAQDNKQPKTQETAAIEGLSL